VQQWVEVGTIKADVTYQTSIFATASVVKFVLDSAESTKYYLFSCKYENTFAGRISTMSMTDILPFGLLDISFDIYDQFVFKTHVFKFQMSQNTISSRNLY
jgi:hypothetical protein